ncbi:hypothetical protein CEXT_22801 [Caerostris extrusa]|uniref:Uncharacterized protein n=1 Tax=Caerostris extrusa TaxID=172846 RepID=A0AAV4Y028_CAEEX|nr:hypothetical protein CEXT_22801 [Caerostris extrusa]
MVKDHENVLKLSDIFGFQQAVRGGLGFSGPNTLFHLAGRMGVHYKLKAKYQQFSIHRDFRYENQPEKTPETTRENCQQPLRVGIFSEEGDRVGGQGGAPTGPSPCGIWRRSA